MWRLSRIWAGVRVALCQGVLTRSLSGTKVKEEREVRAKEERRELSAFQLQTGRTCCGQSRWEGGAFWREGRQNSTLPGNPEVLGPVLGPGRNASLAVPKLRGFFSPFCSRRTFLLMELAAVSRCRSVAGINRLAKAEWNALKNHLPLPRCTRCPVPERELRCRRPTEIPV